MKLYVAGISFKYAQMPLDHFSKTKCIIDSLKEIHQDAVTALGKDASVMIVLQEYALTEKDIPNKEKKECLKRLTAAVKSYKENHKDTLKTMILIPGSFAATEKFSECSNPEKRIKQTRENYNKNFDNNPLFTSDDICYRYYTNAKEMITSNSIYQSTCYQNSAYIITSEPNVKNDKT